MDWMLWTLVALYLLGGVVFACYEAMTFDSRTKAWQAALIIAVSLVLGGTLLAANLLLIRLPYLIGYGAGYLAGRFGDGFRDGKQHGSDY